MKSDARSEMIRKQAREIIDNFAAALEKVGEIKGKELKRHVGGFREEQAGEKCDEDFRGRMFANAPSKEGDCIVAEKKKW